MSLQLAAQHLSNQGRGPDDTLVHMSRDEVKSLNDLAMAHGGQLTINPQTGLPEAGFLSSILPMVAGVALNAAFPGLGAVGAGLLTGAGSMMLNPKAGLMGGLMAGLGAYGGYGLGGGLAEAGVSSESGLTGGANASNATALENAKLAEQAKLAQAAKYTSPDFLDVGGTGSNYLPTGSGGLNVTAPAGNIGADFEQMPGNMPQGNLVSNPLTGAQLPAQPGFTDRLGNMSSGIGEVFKDPSKLKQVGGGSWTSLAQMGLAAAAPSAPGLLKPNSLNMPGSATAGKQVVPHYGFSPGMVTPTPQASATGKENTYFTPQYRALSDAESRQLYPGYPDYVAPTTAANGGLMGYAGGGPVEQMSNDVTTGQNTMYPMANIGTSAFATPYQDPRSTNMIAPTIAPSGGGTVNMMSGEPNMQGTRLAGGGASVEDPYRTTPDDALETAYTKAQEKNDTATMRAIEAEMDIRNTNKAGMEQGLSGMKGLATGGLSDAHYNLGGYSDGGRLLRGPGDGVSDSIPAVIGKKQPARLADGEFVVPARIVSELGNGSTEAGARRLYAMMDRIQAARGKTTGKGKVAKNTRADKYLPA